MAKRAVRLMAMLGLVVTSCDDGIGRPCQDDATCNDGQVCVFDDPEDDVGACDIAAEGEGEGEEGEGEGEGDVAVDVQAGGVFACAIDGRRRVQCWGGNSRGQLGRVTAGSRDDVPAPIPVLHDVVALAVGDTHACAIGQLEGGRNVFCWGDGASLGVPLRQIDVGELVSPQLPNGFGLDAAAIDAGGNNNGGITCVANSDGVVFCFGPLVPDTLDGLPRRIDTLLGAQTLHVTDDGVCATLADNTAACALVSASAFGVFDCAEDGPCEALDGGADFEVSGANACRISDGDALCGGDNTFGVVDPSARAPNTTLPETLVRANVSDVSVGTQHGCAISAGRLLCWGRPLFAATGVLETDVAVTEPCNGAQQTRCHGVLEVAMPQGVGQLSAISTHRTMSCVRSEAGAVACFGSFSADQVGILPTRFALSP